LQWEDLYCMPKDPSSCHRAYAPRTQNADAVAASGPGGTVPPPQVRSGPVRGRLGSPLWLQAEDQRWHTTPERYAPPSVSWRAKSCWRCAEWSTRSAPLTWKRYWARWLTVDSR
jgi:hypothetical protein